MHTRNREFDGRCGVKGRSDWKLHPKLFHQKWAGGLPFFFSWKPDTLVEATDAFDLQWKTFKGYVMVFDRQSPVSGAAITS